jgi:hypothetical protein
MTPPLTLWRGYQPDDAGIYRPIPGSTGFSYISIEAVESSECHSRSTSENPVVRTQKDTTLSFGTKALLPNPIPSQQWRMLSHCRVCKVDPQTEDAERTRDDFCGE